jgi:hypothetical protein
MDNRKIIRQIRMNATRQLRVGAAAARRAKQQLEREHAEYIVFLDDCKAEGIDINTPDGRATALQGWMVKLGHLRREEEEPFLTDGDIFLR